MKKKTIIQRLLLLRERLLIGLVEWTKPWYALWFKRGREAWPHTVQSLKRFPQRSLGRELGEFLEREGLDMMPKLEDHDVLHVLMRYKTTVVDEARMQFFLLGNHKKSVYALFTVCVAVLLIPEHLHSFWLEFRKGRRCARISRWDFRYLLREPTEMLRKQLYRQDMGEEAPFVF